MQTLKFPESNLTESQSIKNLLLSLDSTDSEIKFASAKMLMDISKRNPKALFDQMKYFVILLDCENKILKWTAIDVIANICVADPKKFSPAVFQKFLQLLSDDESMITAGHVIDNLGRIAAVKPSAREAVAKALLNLENSSRNSECKNILLGKAILAFSQFYRNFDNRREIVEFAKRQLQNTRHATQVKSKKFLTLEAGFQNER
jgi:hypothetical protein